MCYCTIKTSPLSKNNPSATLRVTLEYHVVVGVSGNGFALVKSKVIGVSNKPPAALQYKTLVHVSIRTHEPTTLTLLPPKISTILPSKVPVKGFISIV